MPTFVVDWDGTCVQNKWPEEGWWLEGAVDALHTLDRLGTVIIFSVRIAPVLAIFGGEGIVPAGAEIPAPEKAEREVAYIRRMLDQQGLSHVEIWQRPYKPPAAVYIDDRAVRFEGDWDDTVTTVLRVIQPVLA